MPTALRLADRVILARRRRFVGRVAEMLLFQSLLAAEEMPFHIIYLFGPGGVGKTSLLGEFARLCDEVGAPVVAIDGRNIEPSPDSFTAALRLALGLGPFDSPLQLLASRSQRQVILLDTYEVLAPLDDWLREAFLPLLPENTLVVLAGRDAPSPTWRADAGWQALVRALPLRNLSREEGEAYLAGREVHREQYQVVLDFTHGHPLALSLVADVLEQRPNSSFVPEAVPDVVKMLLEQFVRKLPGPAHRAALEACSLVRLATEGLLSEMLGMPDTHELFDWLRDLSFIESGPQGLFPHDLAREALVTDLRWRNPDWYAELHRRARAYYLPRLRRAHGQEQQRILFDHIHLHRDNPAVRPLFDWQESGNMLAAMLLDTDRPALAEMVKRHEGEEIPARILVHRLARQPEGVLVFRDAEQQPAGFVVMVGLDLATTEDLYADPIARAAWEYLRSHTPLRLGERATLFRFWMARDSYQAVSSVQSLIFVTMVRHYLSTPGLAYTFLPCAEPDFWASGFAYADLAQLPEASCQIDGRRFGVFGHDWRVVPPTTWLDLLADREVAARQPLPSRPPATPLVVLARPEFDGAVRDALRDLHCPDALRSNPLVGARVIAARVGATVGPVQRVDALQGLIQQTAESLRASPRRSKCYDALYHTYLRPAPTQERAAELLDLPYSTYRRHLKNGISQMAEILWQQEIGGAEGPGPSC